ncbi:MULTISPECIES: nitronate monooxygenase family protein [unclassified Pseudomonas]|jgi:nitronate monooxygenase|uniref:NAD(P)H-dependent flavin oxidoreductase n=1 Tax=unclassified Pseudomonas TaxID=196821 RepID=UPI000C87F69E|nr:MULTISPECIES: nitronate monooxygenase [unclassified Pseudomonas]PMX20230.1 2-nitropropane dioxygenase [Pseudomonas sp. GW460-12]PMX35078.1 2-nitropropane dioxygenase [Pseudomonas sp. MPR-R2A4]PMX38404.1 2-nitropropane dioxygenase [Pseudomonas sp. MPR-R2A7]PMX51929.1 2-nitropropane dioxygenase [Pseudomonas sp. MPR-R2A6]PMX87179.1 2-nitropropane dioxygenase [Pseudomonas sp. MPR-R2A3]
MSTWPDTRILDLLGIDVPIIQAPMAGATTPAMVIAANQAGALGSMPAAALSTEQLREALATIRQGSTRPINVNFFCHQPPLVDDERDRQWKHLLEPYYRELGADFDAPTPVSNRAPFDDAACQVVEAFCPEVVSFHFGLPEKALLDRVKATGAKVLSSATTVEEAVWLEQQGCDAIIAMGLEAGGHRGIFLSDDLNTQIGLMALVPQIVDAVSVPVIAAGGIGDARGIVAAFALGASAVQMGTAYLFTPEANVSASHHHALRHAQASETALTNLFTGRPARGIVNRVMRELGAINPLAPAFPRAGGALMPLKAKDEAGFSNLWSGQALRLGKDIGTFELTRELARQTLAKLK